MKEQIEQTLQPLIGEPLCGMFCFVGIQAFEFGAHRPCKNRRGEDVFRADLRLHVSCSWEITGPNGFALSHDDFGPIRRDEMAQIVFGAVQRAGLPGPFPTLAP